MWERVYPEIGNVIFVKSIRAKRIIIRISKQAEVRVTIPFFSGIKQAESFVLSKKDWICNTKNSIEQKYQKEYIISDLNFITNKHSLMFVESKNDKIRGVIRNKIIFIYVPITIDRSDDKVQSIIHSMLAIALSKEAKEYIPQRVFEIATQFKFTYSKIRISKAKTRWGSCSGKDNLSFTCYLMRLPSHLIDYIIIHELCHTVHKNHGEKFHALVEQCVGSNKKLYEKELRQHRIR